ncbi:MAG: hypothetical protein D6680_11465, partial [Cyanobacteria bacterium J007]
MSECPVCQTEYVEGEQIACSNCGWDLTPEPPQLAENLTEIYLEKERAKLKWARKIWAETTDQGKSVKELEWKLADIEGQLSKVWGRFDLAAKERVHIQEQVSQLFAWLDEVSQDRNHFKEELERDRLFHETQSEHFENQIGLIFSKLEQSDTERSQVQTQLSRIWSHIEAPRPSPTTAPSDGDRVGAIEENRATNRADGTSVAKEAEIAALQAQISQLKAKLEQSDRERLELQSQIHSERRQVSTLQSQLEKARESLEKTNENLTHTHAESHTVELLIDALGDRSEAIQEFAYAILKRTRSPRARQALEQYKPYRLFRCVRTLKHDDAVRSVAIAPQGNILVSGSNDKTVKIWDLESGQPMRTLRGHLGSAIAVAISADGKTIASGSGDNTIKIWDLQSGELLTTLHGHNGWVNTVAFSPKGRTLASGAADKTIKLWNLDTQELLATF